MSCCCCGAAAGGVSRVADAMGACRQAAWGQEGVGAHTCVQQADTGSQSGMQFHQRVKTPQCVTAAVAVSSVCALSPGLLPLPLAVEAAE